VTARIVPRGEVAPTAAELRAYCVERLAGYKVPKAFEMAKQLPRTASGKLLRRKLS
jgi:acyl-CoA synthetase (AMP-forming)/AMP-acid ligase II